MTKVKKPVEIKPPFDVTIYASDENAEITNPYSGESCRLPAMAVAVYDVIKGGESMGQWDYVRKGLAWFRKHYPDEYMILLD